MPSDSSLGQLAIDYWEHKMRTNPTWALLLGDHRFDDQMEDLSRAAEDDAIEALSGFADAATAIDPAGLDPDDRITRSMLIHEAGADADELRSRLSELAVDPSSGFHVQLVQIVGQIPVATAEQGDAIISKFTKIETLAEQAAQRLRQGLARDRTPPVSAVETVIAQIDTYLSSPIESDPFVNILAPDGWVPEAVDIWRGRLSDVVRDHIRPGYQMYRDIIATEVAPKARSVDRPGVCWLPDGDEVYTRSVKRHTTMELAPLDIHNVGIETIEALAEEYRELGATVLGTIELDEIYAKLREDPALRFESRKEIVAAARSAMDRAIAAVPEWFGRLPATRCVVAEVPEQGGEEAPLAYYFPPAPDGSRPGTFFVNTTEPHTRTRFESEALAFHESVPGHHFQLALAQELEGIPEFRKHALATAYVEGWGLYTERLADEMDLYSSDVARMGMLSFDSWRAGRLVVDTGIHAMGWSRNDAIHYMAMNSPQALNNIETEIDRYIGWPGQALAYLVGRNEIVDVREKAKTALGTVFDIRAFHDTVLTSGPVTLPLLRELVGDWATNRTPA